MSVNPSMAAATYAGAKRHNLIITHHPLIFKAIKSLATDREPGRTTAHLLSHDIALYSAHTNLDATAANRRLGDLLGWQLDKVLEPGGRDPWYKIAVFVPTSQAEDLSRAMWEAGGGRQVGHDMASVMHPGEGTFRARSGVGTIARLQTVAGTRLEIVTPRRDLEGVITAMRRTHPYETVAYDVFELENGGDTWGMGLYGDLLEPVAIRDVAQRVRQALDPRSLRLVGDLDRQIKRVAICSGSGSDLALLAADRGVDLFITGEIRYHSALEAKDRGLAILELGHQASEEPVVDFLVGYLRERLPTTIAVEAFHEQEPFEILK